MDSNLIILLQRFNKTWLATILLEYLPNKERVACQLLNRRWYDEFVPRSLNAMRALPWMRSALRLLAECEPTGLTTQALTSWRRSGSIL